MITTGHCYAEMFLGADDGQGKHLRLALHRPWSCLIGRMFEPTSSACRYTRYTDGILVAIKVDERPGPVSLIFRISTGNQRIGTLVYIEEMLSGSAEKICDLHAFI